MNEVAQNLASTITKTIGGVRFPSRFPPQAIQSIAAQQNSIHSFSTSLQPNQVEKLYGKV